MSEFDPRDPFSIDDEELADIQLQPDYVNLEEEEEEKQAPSPSAKAPEAESKPEQQSSTEDKVNKALSDYSFGVLGESGEEKNIAQQVVGYGVGSLMAGPAGVADFGTDLINLIPGVNMPKAPKFQNEMAQASRDIASVMAPTLFGGQYLQGLGAAANARVGWSIGQNPFVQFIGSMGVDALAGATVDAISSQSEEDNLTGMLKKSFPKTFDFIPDSMATLEGDSPDMKREKNIKEGVGLGLFTGLATGAAKFVNALQGTGRTIKTYGESVESTEWLARNSNPDPTEAKAEMVYNNRPAAEGVDVKARTQWNQLEPEDQQKLIQTYREEGLIKSDVEETLEANLLKQEDALDEVGMYNISNGADLEQPIRGVDDLFEYSESGTRTVDDLGIVGASIDQVRIAKNYDTVNGRLGSVISESALKFAGQSAEDTMNVVTGLASQLDEAGPIAQQGKNWKVSADDVIKQGDITAALMFEPGMTVDELRAIVSPMMATNEFGAPVLLEDGYAGVMKALGFYREELSSMSIARAQGLAMTSVAGQASDLAEGARLMAGTPAQQVAEDQILDNMKFLMLAKNTTDYYVRRKRASMNIFSRGFQSAENFKAVTSEEVNGVMDQITKNVDRFFNNAKTLRATNPEAFDNLMLAYELTDGKIDTMLKLSKYIDASVYDLGKGIINTTPEADNMFITGIWSNIYNSVLSGLGTPIAAMAGNFGGIIARPIATFGGALMNGDLKTVQRSWMAYSALGDTLQKALPYAGSVFRKAAQDPDAVKGVVRTDLMLARENKMQLLQSVAKSEAAKGNTGLQYMVNKIQLLDDLARNPMLRLGPNLLTAVDGLTSSFIANANSRFMALDELAASGQKITRKNVKAAADKRYAEMFDSNGLITDKATKWAADEIALNLNSPIASGMQDATKFVPGLKPFMMFQTTGINMVEMAGKYSPTIVAFQRDVNDLAFTPLSKLLANEDKIDELLTVRGFDITTMDPVSKANRIAEIQAETKGRKAIGALAVTSAIGLLLNDRMSGDGLYDKEAQRAREKMGNWKKRSIKGPDGKWYSYDSLGPLADVMALVANVGDNFDMIGETAVENLFNKISFIVGAAVTDRTALSGIEPLMQMAGGNGNSLVRWSAGFTNSLGPLGGLRNDFSKILSDGLREVDTDFMQYLQNRNLYTEHLNPDNRLPYVYNPIDGKVANSYGLMQRLWNAYSPIKVHDGQSEEQQFVTDFEYAKDWKTIAELHKLRRSGVDSEDVNSQKWRNIGTRIRQAQNYAEELAYARMDAEMRNDIEARIVEKQVKEAAATEGNLIDETLNIRK
jgi:hypothetical protein